MGTGGERVIPADAFFTGVFQTALAPDEVLVEVRVPKLGCLVGLRLREGKSPCAGLGDGGGGRRGARPNGGAGTASVTLTNMGATPLRAEASRRPWRAAPPSPTPPPARRREPSRRPTTPAAPSTAPRWSGALRPGARAGRGLTHPYRRGAGGIPPHDAPGEGRYPAATSSRVLRSASSGVVCPFLQMRRWRSTLGVMTRTSSIETVSRPSRRAFAFAALRRWIAARELAPSSTPSISRVQRTSRTM